MAELIYRRNSVELMPSQLGYIRTLYKDGLERYKPGTNIECINAVGVL